MRTRPAPSARRGFVLASSLLVALLVAGCTAGGTGGVTALSTSTPTSDATSDAACVTDPAAVAAAAEPSDEPLDADTVARLEEAAQAGLAASSSPGAIVGVWGPRGRWVGAYGVADQATGEPMTTDLHTRIGSVTKTFTGTLILQLAEEGLLSLDDTIDQYYPGIVNGDQVTIAQLASMHSGVPSYTTSQAFGEALFSDPVKVVFTPEELLAYVDGQPALFPPGEGYDYSNTNTVLLGLVIEQVTGLSIGEAMQEWIIEPLGLTTTVWPGDSNAIPEPYAHGITLQGVDGDTPADATMYNPSWGFTAGEMISTVDDLLVWGRALATGQGILDEATAVERLESFPGPYRFSYGLGVACFGGWVGHEGELPGYNTDVYYDTETDTTVVTIANSDIASGDCSTSPVLGDDPHGEACSSPAARILVSVTEALGRAFVPNDKT